jgi:tetratricopeptide (TPR) repeat protein
LDEAEALFTRSFEAQDHLQHDSVFALASRDGLARVAAARGDLPRAEAIFREVLGARHRAGFRHSLGTASTLFGLGQVLAARGQLAAAEPLLREALVLRRRELLPQHKDVAATRDALAACLAAQGRTEEAERLLGPPPA